jgi:alpha-L-glutamate ligase-like protein
MRQFLRDVLRRREQVFGMNRRNVELVHRENRREHYPLADDKLLAKSVLERSGVPVPETLATCTGLFAVAPTLERLRALENFVVKPAHGSGGDGIVVVGEQLDEQSWRRAGGKPVTLVELRKHFADIVFGAFSNELEDAGFAERRIEPHPVFRELWPDGLCDIRVLVHRCRPFMAMVRVPTERSGGRANLHSGGLGLAVDLETGRTTRAQCKSDVVTHHPDSGTSLIGIELPAWEATVNAATRAALAVPLGYLGVDVVVSVNAEPLILEINARPGLEIQNVHGVGLGRALREAS